MGTSEVAENPRPSNPLPTVLVVGRFHTEGVAAHIAEGFAALGHPVERFDPAFQRQTTAGKLRKRYEQVRTRLDDLAGNLPFVRARFSERLLSAARSRNIGFTLVCHDFLQPGEIRRLREETGAPVAIWFPDHIGNFSKAWFLSADYDALFFKDPFIVQNLRRTLDKPIYYMPECFNPQRHRLDSLSEEDHRIYGCDVATAGNLYSYRAAFFERLGDYEVKIWGNPPPLWMDDAPIRQMLQGRFVANEDKARAFLAAKIIVNNLNPAEIWGINARTFEIAGIGGFQLVDWRPGLGQLFEDGRELVSFRSMEDLREKIDHYLPLEEERREIARKGHERALRDHSFEVRLPLLVETAFGRAQGYPLPEIAYADD